MSANKTMANMTTTTTTNRQEAKQTEKKRIHFISPLQGYRLQWDSSLKWWNRHLTIEITKLGQHFESVLNGKFSYSFLFHFLLLSLLLVFVQLYIICIYYISGSALYRSLLVINSTHDYAWSDHCDGTVHLT